MTVAMRQRFHAPDTAAELAAIVRDYAAAGVPLEVRGLGSKLALGRPVQAAAVVSSEALSGVTLYEPTELVLSAGAGTPLSEIEALLDENGQQLAFEPVDLSPVYGGKPGEGSIGGLFATGLSGSRRILVGAARDHILGIKGVNGRGEGFKAGGRVMKNVTGYDLSRLLTGSYGTLAVLTEVTTKVLPKPEASHTILFFDLPDAAAVEAMCMAVGSPYEVSGTVHLDSGLAGTLSDRDVSNHGRAVTAIRVESFDSAVRYRISRLKETLAAFKPDADLFTERSRAFWSEIRALKPFQGGRRPLWRIATAPSRAAAFVSGLRHSLEVKALYDWSGGLIWLETGVMSDAGAVEIRRLLSEAGGHATLIRAEPAIRAGIDVFQPLEPILGAATRSLKQAFDPSGVLNPGRMYAGI
jgi:glycolate dehydrogenase FAD-binding subunit